MRDGRLLVAGQTSSSLPSLIPHSSFLVPPFIFRFVPTLIRFLPLLIAAVLGGAESREAIAEFGRTKEPVLRRSLRLEDGIPSPDTFERVSAKLDPTAFAAAFTSWMAAAREANGLVPIALDGKSARGAKKATATGCLHPVPARAADRLSRLHARTPGRRRRLRRHRCSSSCARPTGGEIVPRRARPAGGTTRGWRCDRARR